MIVIAHPATIFRLWDAVGGFLFLFSHMQEKLSKNSSQVDLLKELLNLQKDMITMMLSMLEGNVVNGTIGKQMVDTLVESAANVELILKYFDMFLKLKDLTSTPSFLEIDPNNDGWILPKDFKEKMEQQKSYTPEEIEFLLGEYLETARWRLFILNFPISKLVARSIMMEKLTILHLSIDSTNLQRKSVSILQFF